MQRRPVLFSAFAALFSLPAVARADEAAELEALRKRAAEITGLIEKTKQASLPDAPSFNAQKSVKTGQEVKLPEPEPVKAAPAGAGPKPDSKRSPKEVLKLLLEALINNDTPEENAGLKTALVFSSAANPYSTQPPERFFQAMKNSGYSILLGKYEEAKVGKPDEGKGDDGVPYKVYPVKVQASNRNFLIAGVDSKYLYNTPDKSGSFAIFNWVLSEDPKTKAWLLDTVYLVKRPDADDE